MSQSPESASKPDPTRAAIYARTSTDEDALDRQVQSCIEHAQQHEDIEDWDVYTEQSASDKEPFTEPMRAALDEGEYKYIICADRHRISRDVRSAAVACITALQKDITHRNPRPMTETDTEDEPTVAAIYCRVSTQSQETESQEDVCTRFAEQHPHIDEWDIYKEKETGHNDERKKYVRMKNAIERGEYDYFVCTEFSRISRNDGEIKDFVALCFEQEMGFEVIQNAFSAEPGEDEITRTALKMVADILAGIATMEQLQKIDRIKRGLKYARENEGKFTHRAPAGFEIEDGYIRVDDEDFTAMREALLEHHYNGTPFSTLEEYAPVSRTALSKIYNNDERRNLYVYAEGYDEYGLLDEALEESGWKVAVEKMNDTPEDIDPEQERAQRKRWNRVGDDERALMRTFQDIVQRSREDDEELTEEELLELYEENRDTVAGVRTGDD